MKPIFPYRQYSGAFELAVSAIEIDGDEPNAPVIHVGVSEVDLRLVEQKDWSTLELSIGVTADPAGLARVDEDYSPIEVVATLNVPSTSTRISVRLARDDDGSPEWTGTIRVSREDLAGVGELVATLAGSVGGFSSRVLRTSRTWAVVFDRTMPAPREGGLPVRWANFEDTESPVHHELKQYQREAFYVDLEQDTPVVYLNTAVPHLQDMLDDRDRTHRADRALHEIGRTSIAARVWGALFRAACGDALRSNADQADDAPPEWPSEWRQDVLKRLLASLYPDKSENDGLQSLLDAMRDTSGPAALESRMAMAAERQSTAVVGLRKAADLVYNDAAVLEPAP